jgi:hypothetical protein
VSGAHVQRQDLGPADLSTADHVGVDMLISLFTDP